MCILFLRIALKKCYLTLELSRTVSLSIMLGTEEINLLLVLKIVFKNGKPDVILKRWNSKAIYLQQGKKKTPKPPTLSVLFKIKVINSIWIITIFQVSHRIFLTEITPETYTGKRSRELWRATWMSWSCGGKKIRRAQV